MSAARSSRCLLTQRLAKPLYAIPPRPCDTRLSSVGRVGRAGRVVVEAPPCRRRGMHTTPVCQARRKRFNSVPAEKMGLVTPKQVDDFAQTYFGPYADMDIEALRRHYTDKQLEAIKAGEDAIPPTDLAIQGRWRTDGYKLPYFDDFSTRQPIIDKKEWRRDLGRPDHRSRFMSEKEFEADFNVWLNSFVHPSLKKHPDEILPPEKLERIIDLDDISARDWVEFINERSVFTGGYRDDLPTMDATAPLLMKKVPGVEGLYDPPEVEEEDPIQEKKAVKPEMRVTMLAEQKRGWTEQMLRFVRIRIIETKYVSNQTRLGKVQSLRYTVIAGNGDGWLGVAIVKGGDENTTLLKAKALAIMNMRPIRRYEERTIYGNVEAKFGGTEVKLFTRPPGFGLRLPNNVFHICRFAGLKDLACRMDRATNPMNTVKAVVEALHSQKDPDEIARGRGRKLVDVRKAYYGAENVF